MDFKFVVLGSLAFAFTLSTSGVARTSAVEESFLASGSSTSLQAARVRHPQAEAEDASSFKAKVKKFVEETDFSEMEGKTLKAKDMKGAAVTYYKKMNKDWGSDYPPVAKLVEVAGQKVIIIETDTDGGSYTAVFYPSGKLIAEGSAGESDGFSWTH